jgi:hypothetical protein
VAGEQFDMNSYDDDAHKAVLKMQQVREREREQGRVCDREEPGEERERERRRECV